MSEQELDQDLDQALLDVEEALKPEISVEILPIQEPELFEVPVYKLYVTPEVLGNLRRDEAFTQKGPK